MEESPAISETKIQLGQKVKNTNSFSGFLSRLPLLKPSFLENKAKPEVTERPVQEMKEIFTRREDFERKKKELYAYRLEAERLNANGNGKKDEIINKTIEDLKNRVEEDKNLPKIDATGFNAREIGAEYEFHYGGSIPSGRIYERQMRYFNSAGKMLRGHNGKPVSVNIAVYNDYKKAQDGQAVYYIPLIGLTESNGGRVPEPVGAVIERNPQIQEQKAEAVQVFSQPQEAVVM